VTNFTTYYYAVTAVNANGSIVPVIPSESAPSAEVSATPRIVIRDDIVGRASQLGSWWLGASNGSNGFTTSLFTTWSTGANWVDVQTGDFNGDGKTDIAGRDPQTGNWWVTLSGSSGPTTSVWTAWSTVATWVDVKV